MEFARLTSAFVLSAGLGIIVSAAQAQEYPGCFMTQSTGQIFDLSGMCQKTNPQSVPLDVPSTPLTSVGESTSSSVGGKPEIVARLGRIYQEMDRVERDYLSQFRQESARLSPSVRSALEAYTTNPTLELLSFAGVCGVGSGVERDAAPVEAKTPAEASSVRAKISGEYCGKMRSLNSELSSLNNQVKPLRTPQQGRGMCPYDRDDNGRNYGRRSNFARSGGNTEPCYL